MAGPTYGSQGTVTAMSLAVSIFDQVQSRFLDVKYPDHDWRKVIDPAQILTDINAGAQNYVQMVRDQRGAAAFQANIVGDNVPMVGLSMGAITVPLAASAVGARVSNEDARQYDYGFRGTLSKDLGAVMQKAEENLIESTFFYGDTTVGFLGWLSYTGVTAATAALGAALGTTWATKTAAEMVSDINTGLTAVWNNSRTVFKAGDVFLPPTQFALLQSTPMVIGGAGMAMSALDYVKKNNLYTTLTGKELNIVPIRYLSNAGAGSSARMVFMAKDAENQIIPMPMPYKLQAPVPVPLGAAFYAEMKHGSFACFQPKSMYYIDGI